MEATTAWPFRCASLVSVALPFLPLPLVCQPSSWPNGEEACWVKGASGPCAKGEPPGAPPLP
eukprot:9077269-Alexandrium_andersonii.AAC.1